MIVYDAAVASLSLPIAPDNNESSDKAVNHAIKTGVLLSRSEVKWFDHNGNFALSALLCFALHFMNDLYRALRGSDMGQLEEILKGIKEEDERTKRPLNRRFLIIEGLYVNTGSACFRRILEIRLVICVQILLRCPRLWS